MNNIPRKDWHDRYRSYHDRPTIAYLAPSISGGSLAQWSGIVDSAMAHGLNLLSVPGASLHDPRAFIAQANIIYQLINPASVQGVIAWTSTIGNFVDEDTIKAFCDNYRGVPFVSIGRIQSGVTNLLMDSYQGMCEAILHLIEVHGYRRIAFLRGPENHTYARERLRAYTETLEACDIPYDPQLVTPASRDWERNTGAEMMRVLLDDRGLKPQTHIEALVAANDDLILGAWQVLRERKIRVPDDVALVGFDHVIDGQVSTPPLTSVAAPFYDVGYQAVNLLLARMAGEEVPDLVTVPSILMIHQSCGCQSLAVQQASFQASDLVQVQASRSKSPAELLAARRIDLPAKIERAVSELGGKLAPESAVHWLEGLVSDLEGGASGSFLAALQETLYQTMIDDGDILALHGAISILGQEIVPHLNTGADTLLFASSLFQQAQIVISEAAQRRQAHRQALAEQRAQCLAEAGAALITAFDLDELMNTLAESLPQLNILSAYLILYQEPTRYQYPALPPEWSLLVLAFDEHIRIAAGANGEPFRTQELLPTGLQVSGRSRSLAVMPLYFRDQQLGIGIFEASAQDGPTIERLRGQISSALQGALLMQQVQQHTAQLATIITETLATSEEMGVTITQTSRQAKAVANAAQQSVDVSRTGQDAVTNTITGMEAIQRQVADIARSILALSERTQQIGQIISAVEEIADQSRLLALNASIEAARAGEQGLGFAVVAREMRHLAGQSRAATTQVSRILNDIQQAANTAVMVTEEGSKGAHQGMELASQAGTSIRNLSAVIEEAAQVAAQIAASTQQQSNAMDQLVSAIRSIKLASNQSITGFRDDSR